MTRPLLLASAGAALMVLAHEPFAFGPLAYVALLPWLALARLPAARCSARRRFVAAWLGGVLMFGAGCAWLAVTSPINLAAMALPEALALPFTVALLRAPLAARLPAAVALPVAWVAVEFTRSRWPWGGFPWLQLGATQVHPLECAQAAEWVGVGGLSVLVAIVNGALADAFRHARPAGGRRGVALAALAVAALVPAGLFALGSVRMPQVRAAERPGPVVALVQANIPQRLKHSGESQVEIFTRQERLSERALADARARGLAVDLLIWPETMFPWPLSLEPPGAAAGRWFEAGDQVFGAAEAAQTEQRLIVERLAHRLLEPADAWLLLGAIAHAGATPTTRRSYNAALLFDPAGERRGAYAKSILVPGGEFIPLRRMLPRSLERLLLRAIEGFAGFVPALDPGPGPRPLVLGREGGGALRVAVTICYENTYSSYAARVARGADVVVNLSNEGWFGTSAEFDQMDAASRLRAIEARRPLVRATNTGISSVYAATGERRATLLGEDGADRAVEGVLVAQVPLSGTDAAYAALGDLPAWLLAVAAAGLGAHGALAGIRRRYRVRRDR